MRKMWSKNQLTQEVVKGLVNEDVKVKTIEQSEYEYVKDLTFTPSSEHFIANSSFTKILVKNKSMYICIVYKYTNTDTSAHTTSFSLLEVSDIPLKYQKLIFDVNGKSLDEAPTGDVSNAIARFPLYFGGSLVYVSLIHNGAGKMSLYPSASSSSVGGGDSILVDGRIELLL